jgi:hypothetical protein
MKKLILIVILFLCVPGILALIPIIAAGLPKIKKIYGDLICRQIPPFQSVSTDTMQN